MEFEALLTFTSCDPLREFVLPVPTALGYGSLESLVFKDEIFLPEDTASFSLNYKLLLPPGHIGFFVQEASRLEDESPGSDLQEEVELLLCSRRDRTVFGIQVVHAGALLYSLTQLRTGAQASQG